MLRWVFLVELKPTKLKLNHLLKCEIITRLQSCLQSCTYPFRYRNIAIHTVDENYVIVF